MQGNAGYVFCNGTIANWIYRAKPAKNRPPTIRLNFDTAGNAMLLSWFNAKDAHQFGGELAQLFIGKMPLDTRRKDKKFATKAQGVLNSLDQRIKQFKVQHKLNLYTRARLGNQFKWTLKDAGYDESYVEELTEWLLQRL
jgi:hypothetical protein